MTATSQPHALFLFDMKGGGKKLAYGRSPEDALDVLRLRLSEPEMEEIVATSCQKISQRRLQEYVHLLR